MSSHHHHAPPPYQASPSHHHSHHQHHQHHQPKSHHGHHGFDHHHVRRDSCHCIGICVCSRQPLSHFPQPPRLHYHTFPTTPIHHQVHISGHPPPVVNTVLVRSWIRRHERIQRRHEQGVDWSTPIRGECLRPGVRQYRAMLIRYTPDYYWREACETTEFHMHGRQFYPTRCTLAPIFNYVMGEWEVNFREPECTAVWDSATDEGCSGPGERRFSARILNIDNPDEWESVCATTPLEIRGVTQLPQECSNKGILGTWGHWNMSDPNCDAA